MKKEIKEWGNSIVIRFSPEEAEIYNLNKGDIVNIELCKIKKEKK